MGITGAVKLQFNELSNQRPLPFKFMGQDGLNDILANIMAEENEMREYWDKGHLSFGAILRVEELPLPPSPLGGHIYPIFPIPCVPLLSYQVLSILDSVLGSPVMLTQSGRLYRGAINFPNVLDHI